MLKLESRGRYLPKMTAVALKKVDPFILIARQKSECMHCICRRGLYMYAKQLKASIRPRKWFNINLGTAVIARMNIILGTLTLGICLDLYYFQYCCTISRNSWDVHRKICNQLFSTLCQKRNTWYLLISWFAFNIATTISKKSHYVIFLTFPVGF